MRYPIERMIAYCGLLCTDCPAFIATRTDDQAVLDRVAAQWRDSFNAPEITAQPITCGGCLGDSGQKCTHCFDCQIRACTVGRGVANCAHCTDYRCEILENFFGLASEAQDLLDSIHAGPVA